VGKDKNLEIVLIPHNKIAQGVRELISRGVSQLIWIQTQTADVEFAAGQQLINMLKQVNTVIYNYHEHEHDWSKTLLSSGVNCVCIDRISGFKKLAEFLKNNGNKHVALGWSKNLPLRYHVPFEDADMKIYWIKQTKTQKTVKAFAEELATNFYSHPDRKSINTICTLDDMLAGFLIKSLISKGIAVPDDVSVTGFDGMDFTEFTTVPLTTLAVPTCKMVQKTIKLLSNKSKGKMFKFNPELILRESHKSR
jgi:DNA-binding LacI/PurR family transcriptional regulator